MSEVNGTEPPKSSHKAITLIAFDYGLKSIGVAYGQSLTHTASELKPVSAKDGTPDWEVIKKLIEEWRPQLLIVGLPLNMDDSESEFSLRCRKFSRRLHGRFQLPVELYDERLTTRLAKTEANTRGHKGNYARQPVDSIAARLLLEGWLESYGH